MGRFVNATTKITVSVNDSKDSRFPESAGWSPVSDEPKKPARKTAGKSES